MANNAQYVQKKGLLVKSDPPRPLNDKEIKEILELVGLEKAPNSKVKELRDQQVKEALLRRLKKIKLVPQAFKEFRDSIAEQYFKSLAEPGLAVGIIPGEGIGKVTQLALKTRHTGGSNTNVGSGIEILKEMIDATKNRKNPLMVLHLVGYPSRDKVIEKGRELVELKVPRLLEEKNGYSLMVRDDVEDEDIWWHEAWRQLTKRKIPKSVTFMRLTFSKVDLYNYRLTLNDICKFIEEINDYNVCIPSPFSIGCIDVFPTEKGLETTKALSREKGLSPFDVERSYFQNVFMEKIGEFKIRGIEGIKSFGVSSDKLSDFLTIKRSGGSDWKVTVQHFKARNKFIKIEQFLTFFEKMGVSVKSKDKFDKYNPSYSFTVEYKEDLNKFVKEEYPQQNPINFERYGNFWSINTLGVNLLDVFCDPEIDRTRSRCNIVHESVDYFGVETGRSTFIRELHVVMKEGDLSTRHYETIADSFFSMGRYFGSNVAGIAKKGADPMSLASFQSATDFVRLSAITSKTSRASSLATAIATGQPIPFGSGMVHVESAGKEKMREYERKYASPAFVDATRKYEYAVEAPALQGEMPAIKEEVSVPLVNAEVEIDSELEIKEKKVFELPDDLSFTLSFDKNMSAKK